MFIIRFYIFENELNFVKTDQSPLISSNKTPNSQKDEKNSYFKIK